MSLKILLERTGLTRYQQRIFIELVKNPNRTAQRLSALSKVPIGRIYTELDALENLSLINSTSSRPRKYFILNPKTTIINLLESEKKKLEDLEKSSLEDLGSDYKDAEIFHSTAEIRQSQILSFRWAQEEVCQCLGIIHKASENRDLKSVYEKEIINAVERKVQFKALYLEGQRPPESLIELNKEYPEYFKIRFSKLPIPRFDLVDKHQILFKIQDPMDTSTTVGTIIINNLTLAKKLRQKFINLWIESKEFKTE